MSDAKWWDEEWSPPWARHVAGKIAKRVVDEDGTPEPQRVEIRCGACGAEWRGLCTSGATRNLVSKYAMAHVECVRDPLAKPVLEKK